MPLTLRPLPCCVYDRPIVFIGPFEHHSNILPWRENNVDVVAIAEDARGGLDLDDLEAKLKKYSRRKLKIGERATNWYFLVWCL